MRVANAARDYCSSFSVPHMHAYWMRSSASATSDRLRFSGTSVCIETPVAINLIGPFSVVLTLRYEKTTLGICHGQSGTLYGQCAQQPEMKRQQCLVFVYSNHRQASHIVTRKCPLFGIATGEQKKNITGSPRGTRRYRRLCVCQSIYILFRR